MSAVLRPSSRYGPHKPPSAVSAPPDLVRKIYEAALDTSRWVEVMADVGRLVAGQQMIMFSVGVTPGHEDFFWSSNSIPLDTQIDYVRYYWQYDLWNSAIFADAREFCSGSVQLDQDIVDQRHFDRSVFRNEFLRGLDIYRAGGAVISNGSVPGMPPIYLSMFRNDRGDAFQDIDAARLASVVPHLQRALRLAYRLNRDGFTGRSSGFLFEQSREAIFLVTRNAQVVHANAEARRLLTLSDGLFQGHGGVLEAGTRQQTATLHRLVHAAAETTRNAGISAGGAVHVPRTPPRSSLRLDVSPLPSSHQFDAGSLHAAAVIQVEAPEMSGLRGERALHEAFGLTPTECRVAFAILAGMSAREMAGRFGTTVNTVQSQIKRVYAKTGIHRQGALVRLLVSLP